MHTHTHSQAHYVVNTCTLTHNKIPRVNVHRSLFPLSKEIDTVEQSAGYNRFTDHNNWGGAE